MNTKVIMLSDFCERAWAFEDALKEFTAAEVTWMSARHSEPEFFRALKADIVIADTTHFDFSFVLHLDPSTPVILLVDDDHPITLMNLPENMVTLNKRSNPARLLHLYETVRYGKTARKLLPAGKHEGFPLVAGLLPAAR